MSSNFKIWNIHGCSVNVFVDDKCSVVSFDGDSVLEVNLVAVDDLINELLDIVDGVGAEMTPAQRFNVLFGSELNLVDIVDGKERGYKTVTEHHVILAMRLIRETMDKEGGTTAKEKPEKYSTFYGYVE